jgi:NtrC-family two-component system response regulator AlgB
VGEAKIRRANVRVIAATNRNLEKAVEEGRFREDLFYRLNVIALRLPLLRERMGDLMNMAMGYLQFFAGHCGKKLHGFSSLAEQAMRRYSWPGNLRELRNVIERAVILAGADHIDCCDLPEKLSLLLAGQPSGIQVGARDVGVPRERAHSPRPVGCALAGGSGADTGH